MNFNTNKRITFVISRNSLKQIVFDFAKKNHIKETEAARLLIAKGHEYEKLLEKQNAEKKKEG